MDTSAFVPWFVHYFFFASFFEVLCLSIIRQNSTDCILYHRPHFQLCIQWNILHPCKKLAEFKSQNNVHRYAPQILCDDNSMISHLVWCLSFTAVPFYKWSDYWWNEVYPNHFNFQILTNDHIHSCTYHFIVSQPLGLLEGPHVLNLQMAIQYYSIPQPWFVFIYHCCTMFTMNETLKLKFLLLNHGKEGGFFKFTSSLPLALKSSSLVLNNLMAFTTWHQF